MNDKDLEQIATGINQSAEQPAAAAVTPPNVQPATERPLVKIADIQTAETTLMADPTPSKPDTKGDFNPDDKGVSFFKTFIGLNKDNYNRLNETVTDWTLYRASLGYLSMSDKERDKLDITVSECQAAVAKWTEYCDQHYPGIDMEVLNTRFLALYGFIQNIFDPVMVQFPILNEQGISNQNQRTTKIATADVNGVVPSRAKDDKRFSLSEFMRRTSLNSTGEAYQYDLLLRNSYVALSYKKSGKLDLADLINNIAKAVTGHVRHVQQNVPALSNIAVIRVIWNFIKDRIIRTSMKDVNDFDELADVILITDMQAITTALLDNAYPRGVNFQLQCLGEDSCDWTKTKVIDPSVLVRDRKWLDTKEEAAAYGNMINFSRKYSREESIAFQRGTNYQHDIQPVYNHLKNSWFVLKAPTLSESFEAEEFFAEHIKEQISQIQQTSITEQQFVERRDELLNGLVGTDYLHYVSEYHTMSDNDPEQNVTIVRRSESPPDEFNKGLIDIILENQEMGADLIDTIVRHYPYMSKTFVGMSNYTCENCAGKSAGMEELGYTPINVINAFFTLTSQTFTGRARVGENAMEEALSRILE